MKKTFTLHTLLLSIFGIVLNIGLAYFARETGMPLFLDSIGTVIVAAFGGFIPSVAVGFSSNFISSISDPISRYYGILSILIAIVISWMSERGYLKKIKGYIIAALICAVIGGGLGSVLTWILYGFSFGQGISAPYAEFLYGNFGIPQFWAQFIADMGIDIADKFVTFIPLYLLVKYLPRRFINKFPLGYIYLGVVRTVSGKEKKFLSGVKKSLRRKISLLLVILVFVISAVSVGIGTTVYKENTITRYNDDCTSVTELVKSYIDGDKIDAYILNGENDTEYKKVENSLYEILHSMKSIEYIYVYQIKNDGCHVVFDLDTEGLEGGNPGDVIPFDESFSEYIPDLLAGNNIVPVISDDTYGWLLTVYNPIYDSNGKCTAYAAADIDMQQIRTDNIIFVSRMASVLVGMLIVMLAYSTWYSEKSVVEPINKLVRQTRRFSLNKEGNRLTEYRRNPLNAIKTGDEIEELYHSMCGSEDAIIEYITEINRKNKEITTMQKNIIFSFASMVENRDMNTGEHIKRTSGYVGVIARRLIADGKFSGILTPEIAEMFEQSAPLHDIGKIKISDLILNKPGKLTDEEFTEMKTHTTVGRDILLSSLEGIEDGGYLKIAADMAESHHEKWNGSGYPSGLKGDEIPLCARIMAVADVFDALVSKRSYKEPMSFEQATEIIKNDAGSHFDADVVNAFIEESDKVRRIAGGLS